MVSWSNNVLLDEQGNVEHVFSVGIDITRQRAAQQANAQNASALSQLHSITSDSSINLHQKFNQLLQLGIEVFNLDIGIISHITDEDYVVEYIQGPEGIPVAGSHFNFLETYCFHTYQADAPTGFHHTANSRIKNHPCYKKFCLESYLGAPVFVNSKRYGTLNFSSAHFHKSAFTENEYSLIQLFAQWVGHELERQQNEHALKKSNYMLQAVLDTIPVPVFWKDLNCHYLGCNRLFAQNAGIDLPESIIGKTDFEMPWKQQAELYREDDLIIMQSATPKLNYEEPISHKDGSVSWLETSKIPLVDIDGNTYGVLGTFQDITERKRVDQMKNEFISTVSHEIRTPLTSIRGALSLLGSSISHVLPGDDQKLLQIASNNTERLLLLINDILDIQKIESGNISFHYATHKLMPLIEQSISDNQGYAEQYRVSLQVKQRLDDASVFVDSNRFLQIMNNLVSNAAKFSPPGEQIEINVSRHHDALRISITDHGPGIPDYFKDRIFHKFTQVDASDSRQKGGTGLGLAITKSLVERHGGRIEFISEANIGTTFYFELPEINDTHLLDSRLPGTLAEHDKCLLIIEDDRHVASILQRIVTETGFLSDVACSAEEARILLKKNQACYKLITLDIMLPGEDGVALFRELRSNPDTAHIPVIVISAKADETRRQLNGGAVGILDWLQKPVDINRLNSLLMPFINQQQQPRLLHIEDDESIHFIVRQLLTDRAQITLAKDCDHARSLLTSASWSLVLLDIHLGHCSGLELIDDIRKNSGNPSLVIFSAYPVNREDAEKVDAVLLKSSTSNEQLLHIISNHLRARR